MTKKLFCCLTFLQALASFGTHNAQADFYFNLSEYPYFETEYPHYEKTSAALIQSTLKYIWNDDMTRLDPHIPDTIEAFILSQEVIYQYALPKSQYPPYIDAPAFRDTLNENRPQDYNTYGYNFSIRSHPTDKDYVIDHLCQWVSYTIGTYGGHEEGHPDHVPSFTSLYGYYDNWIAITGIHTDVNPYPLPDTLNIYHLWLNDPTPALTGGLGENFYMDIYEFDSSLIQAPVEGFEEYAYFAVVEPPPEDFVPIGVDGKLHDFEDMEIIKVRLPARFERVTDGDVTNIVLLTPNAPAEGAGTRSTFVDPVVQAAYDAANEELRPYDERYRALLDNATPGEPILVKWDNGEDNYFAIPFNTIEEGRITDKASIVVVIDVHDGHFKQTSWTENAAPYPPVDRSAAEERFRAELLTLAQEGAVRPSVVNQGLTLDLVFSYTSGECPYYPRWKVVGQTVEGYVSQTGECEVTRLPPSVMWDRD